jgi:SAM-dependent methyltransferase
LDIASGEGYGSAILAEKAEKVFGVDISLDAITHAKGRYKFDNLSFKVGDCIDIPLSNSIVDLVVSFETLEHVEQQNEMLREIKRVMKPDGIIIISTPDKFNYSIKNSYSNPFHKKELLKNEFVELLQGFFKNITILGQRIVYGSNLTTESQSTPYFSYFLKDGTLETTAGVKDPTYLIILASDGVLPSIRSSFFEQPINESEIIQAWRKVVTERDQSIQNLNNSLAERDHAIQSLNVQLAEREQEVLFYALSKSWRFTRLLRKVAKVFRGKRKEDD